MQPSARRRPLALLVAALLAGSGPALAEELSANPSQTELIQLLQQMNQRLEKLEQRNAQLEKQVAQQGSTSRKRQPQSPLAAAVMDKVQGHPEGALEKRVEALEAQNTRVAQGLESEEVSENEPELTARLKAVEYQSLDMLKMARTVEALDGITAGVSFTTVAQKPSGMPASSSVNNSQLNYRGDIFVTLPLDNIGDVESRIFAQIRVGQGSGLNAMPSYSKPNASAFRVLGTDPDNSVAVLGQAWYQATIPLPFGGYKPRSREKLEVNFGKMDPFVFFDQNAAANDETKQFLNTVFVHNPLLDAGGDIGVDANGFAPGFRMSYLNETEKPETWRLSGGVFGAGQGANYTRFFSSPMVILQAETQRKFFDGLTGNYRVYYWHNGQATAYDSQVESHSGFGISADQRVGDGFTLFGRYGHQLTGHVRFNRALTLGTEINGSYWDRGGDSIGLAYAWLHTSSDFNRDSAGISDYGFTAMGAEQVLETYYRYRINKQFEVSPDFQYLARPGGDPDAKATKVLGLRAQITF